MTLISKPDCCLCSTAKMIVNRLKLLYSFDVEEIDVSQDQALWRRYAECIPVILVNGQEVCCGRVDERKIKSAIEKLAVLVE